METTCEDFETALVEELRMLKTGERRLQRLYPRLRSQPQLREYFLLELADLRQRADRLNAVLNPTCIAHLPESYAAPTLNPAA